MIVWHPGHSHPSGTPEFTLFNTLVPRGHPVFSRRFRAPWIYRDWFPFVHLDCDRCLGTLDQDRALATDPTQAIFVVELVSRDRDESRVLLVVRIQALIEHMYSVSTGDYVPWHKWGKGVVVMGIPHRSNSSRPLVQGSHVVMADHPHLRTFDFSRRGCGVLLRWYGVEWWTLFEDGRVVPLQGKEYVRLVSSFRPASGKW